MIVDGDREDLLGVILADHVVVENLSDLLRRRDAVLRFRQRGSLLLTNDVHAKLDAFVADEHGRTGNELAHLVLALAAERAMERGLGLSIVDLAHLRTSIKIQEPSHSLIHSPNQACALEPPNMSNAPVQRKSRSRLITCRESS